MIALVVKAELEKHAWNVVSAISWKAQFVTPPPVDHTGAAPAFTMLLVKTKFFIGVVVATIAPITNSMCDGNAVI